jgi:hypothetical protein
MKDLAPLRQLRGRASASAFAFPIVALVALPVACGGRADPAGTEPDDTSSSANAHGALSSLVSNSRAPAPRTVRGIPVRATLVGHETGR